MQKSISTDIIINNKIVTYGRVTIEFTGDEITEEIVEAGVKAMEAYLTSYKKAVGIDEAS